MPHNMKYIQGSAKNKKKQLTVLHPCMVQKLPDWQPVKILSTLHTASPYNRNLALSISCISDLFLPHTTHNPPPAVQISYTLHIFLNLVNIPVPVLPWLHYTIITASISNPKKIQEDSSVTPKSEGKELNIPWRQYHPYNQSGLKCQPQVY